MRLAPKAVARLRQRLLSDRLAEEDQALSQRVLGILRASRPLIYLDVSRLFREHHGRHTGISRVELRYLEHFDQHPEFRLICVRQRRGRLFLLPKSSVYAHLVNVGWWPADARVASDSLRPVQPLARAKRVERGVYINASHAGLEDSSLFTRLAHELRWKSLFYIHDLIPIEFPQLAGEGSAERHVRRMITVAGSADVVVANSDATAASFRRFLGRYRFDERPIEVVRIGAGTGHQIFGKGGSCLAGTSDPSPYFLAVSTIEPRKNHMLLLQLWRVLAERLGERTPRLVIVGRRGWQQTPVFQMIDRAIADGLPVEEHGQVNDEELGRLYRGAQALLMPSFAEGWGMPIAEALSCGTPVIASNIPAHRELAGDAALLLAPDNLEAWFDALMLAQSGQLRDRVAAYRPVSWHCELAKLDELVRRLSHTLAKAPVGRDARRRRQ